MSLPRFAVRRPVTTGMLVMATIVAGAISAGLISLDLFPSFEQPVIQVSVPYPDANPNEVERRIVRPLEEGLGTLRNLESIRSTAGQNQGRVELEYEAGTDMDVASLEARERVEVIRRELPEDVREVRIQRFSSEDFPVLQGSIHWDGELEALSELVERQVEPAILQVPGVAAVEFSGLQEREVMIDLDQDRMRSAGVSLQQVNEAVSAGNEDVSAGALEAGGWRYLVRARGQLAEVEQLRELRVGPNGVRLGDVADVRYDYPERDFFYRLNGESARQMQIYKEADANIVEVSRSIRTALDELQERPGLEGVRFSYWQDQSEGILEVLSLLGQAGVVGGVMAVLTLLAFLRRFTPTLIVAAAIPVSLIFTVAILYVFGATLNVITLSGLMLAVGMLIDNAVVVVENIFRHREMGSDPGTASVEGATEVGLAILSGTLTTVIVFAPLVFTSPDQMGVQFREFGMSISFAMVASLVVAFTLVPLLAVRFMAGRIPPPGRLFALLRDGYRRLLARALDYRLAVGACTLLLFAAGGWVLYDLPRELQPQQDQRMVRISVSTPSDMSVEERSDAFAEAERAILERADELEVEDVSVFSRPEFGSLFLALKPYSEGGETPTALITEEVRELLPEIPGVEWSQRAGFGGRGGDGVTVRLIGESTERLALIAEDVERTLRARVPGMRNFENSLEAGNEEVRVRIDRDAVEREGLTSEQVARSIAGGLRGEAVSRFRTGDREVDIVLQLREEDRVSVDQLANLAVGTPDGGSVPLGAVAEYRVVGGPQTIQREDRLTTVTVEGDLAYGANREEVLGDVRAAMATVDLPAGYRWDLGRRFGQEQQQFGEMLAAAVLALVLIYILLAALFESLVLPMIIYFSIFFAAPGLGLVFLITGGSLSILSFLGILITIGIVVNNSIVMIDLVNQLRDRGMDRTEAVLEGCEARFRPVLMTSLTTLIGLVPMAFMGGTEGLGALFQPIGQAVIGGLTTSTLLTLLLTPTLYTWLDDVGIWGARTWRDAVALAGGTGASERPVGAAGD